MGPTGPGTKNDYAGEGQQQFTRNRMFFLSALWGYWHCGHSWPIMPASGDSADDCGEADGM
jgi:hypothetical protein